AKGTFEKLCSGDRVGMSPEDVCLDVIVCRPGS
ncbi:MAG: hypothetical protein ACJAQW_002264, partial [Paracoccaceae bacterium]